MDTFVRRNVGAVHEFAGRRVVRERRCLLRAWDR